MQTSIIVLVYFLKLTEPGKICGDGHLHSNLFALCAQRLSCSSRKTEMIDKKNPKTIKKERREKKLRVPVLPIEEAEIKSKATDVGLTVAEYLRNLGLGYQVPSVIDNRKVDALLKINADLGRLGGLIKLWLTNDKRTKLIGKSQLHMTLDGIRNTQSTMLDVIMKLKK